MIEFNVKEKMLKGINVLADAVQVTLGPKGRNVIIKDTHVTKDGVSVAKEVFLEDPIENTGAQLIKNASAKTCSDAGDGTTTSTILTRAIIKEGMKYLSAGIDPNELKRIIDKDVKVVVDYIRQNKLDVDLDRIEQIATISANNDEYIGKLIRVIYENIGNSGVITLEENKGAETEIRIVKGLQIDRGYASPYFINNADEQLCEFNNPMIITVDKINVYKDIKNTLEQAYTNNTPLVILTENINPDVINTLVLNKVQKHLQVCVVKVPFEYLKLNYQNCEKVSISYDKTLIIGGEHEAKAAVLYIGANTEIELKEKKDRAEDAICAVRAAIEEGIVPGGGFTYVQASKLLESGIIKNALLFPAKQIANNAGVSGEVVVEKIKESNLGYNAKEDKYEDLLQCGIIDPAKVTRVALENAASIATMFLLIECVIHNERRTL